MTNSPPRAPRPSAIRRRPLPDSSQSVEEFIQAGTGVDGSPAEGASATSVSATPSTASKPTPQIPLKQQTHVRRGGGNAHFALFLSMCALGVASFDAYRLLLPQPTPVVPVTSPRESLPSKVVASPPPPAAAPAPTPSMSASQGIQWLAITDLQFARHDLLLGLNDSAIASLVLAKIHLNFLGKPFAPESIELDRILSGLQSAPVLSLGHLDRDIEALKETWVRVTFGPPPLGGDTGLLGWLTPWHKSNHPESRTELETTDAGRYLVARLDRLKWLALWGDEAGLRSASATLEDLLGSQFLKSPEAKPWLFWIRSLQRTPLRHDVTELNTLIVRLSRMELPP